jgi:hypothetical protein
MALTVESQQRLAHVGLCEFFSSSRDKWCGMAQQSLEFIARNFPKGVTIHPDDVSKALFVLMEVNVELDEYRSKKGLHQKYWLTDFCDLILAECWPELKVPPGLPGNPQLWAGEI